MGGGWLVSGGGSRSSSGGLTGGSVTGRADSQLVVQVAGCKLIVGRS